MHPLSLALVALALLAAPAAALDVVELKDGRVLVVEEVSVKGDKLRVRLHLERPDQYIAYTIPFDKVVPHYVYYAWAAQLDPGDVAGAKELAAWARAQGLFGLARKTYESAAEHSQELAASLDDLKREMHEEEATWHFTAAERLFRENAVKEARFHAEQVLDRFADSKEVGRTKELLMILAEREQFLSEQKKQEEIAQRARRQKRQVDKHLDRIARADRYVLKARLYRPGHAERRLSWAAFAYRDASLAFADLLPLVEVDDLRLTLEALLRDLDDRMVRTFTKLADLRFVNGDAHGALDAVHEVLTIDPGNKEAGGLRKRILDGGRPREPVSISYPSYFRRRFHPVIFRGFGIHPCSSVYRVRVRGLGFYAYR